MAKKVTSHEVMKWDLVVNGNQAQKELYDLEQSTRNLNAEYKDMRAEKAKLKAQNQQGTEEYKNLTAAMKKNKAEVLANKNRTKELQKEIGITGLTMRQLKKRAQELRVQLYNMIPGSAKEKKYRAELKKINSRISELNTRSRVASKGIKGLAAGFNKFAALGTAAIATVTGFVVSAKNMIDYLGKISDAQADVRRTTGMTQDEVEKLTKSFGRLDTRSSRTELLKLAETAGRLGISAPKEVEEFATAMNKIKVALEGDLSEDQILDVGKMVKVFKLGEKEGKTFAESLDALGSSINTVSQSGPNQASFLVNFMKRMGGVAHQAGLTADQVVGMAAAFDESGQTAEISATTMNKVLIDMAQNADTYAGIAGMSVKEFAKTFDEDANTAVTKFLEGLKNSKGGFSALANRLKEINAGGTRGAAALASLSNSLDVMKERQGQANTSMEKATSLTREYNLKNETLEATMKKISRRFMGIFTSDTVTNGLKSLVSGFAKLIGAVKDVDKAFSEETKRSAESARASRQNANESQNLLDRYEELTKDGIEPSKEEKEELDLITLQLKDHLGDSVMAIDEETGAYKLNTEEVRKQIKIKRLAADEEAATMASRLANLKDNIKELEILERNAEKEYNIRRNKILKDNPNIKNPDVLNVPEFVQGVENSDEFRESQKRYWALMNDLKRKKKNRDELIKALQDLNYDENDVKNMFGTSDRPEEPEVIDEDFDQTTTTSSTSKSPRLKAAKDLSSELLRVERQLTDDRFALMDESFKKELQKLEEEHKRKLEDLKNQKYEEAEIQNMDVRIAEASRQGDTQLVSDLQRQKEQMIEINDNLNERMLQEEEIFQQRKGTLIVNGLKKQLEEDNKAFEREKKQRQINHNQALAAVAGNEEKTAELKKQFRLEDEQAEQEHLQKLVNMVRTIKETGEFEGLDLTLLSDEEAQKVSDYLDDLKLKLSEVGLELSNLRSAGDDDDDIETADLADIDIFGFSAEDWENTFENLDTTKEKMAAISMAIQGMANAYKMYADYQTAADRRNFKEWERNADNKKRDQDKLLKESFISQKQHDDAVEALEEEKEKKRAEMEYKASMREWRYNLASAIANTALGVAKALPNIPLSIMVGALGAAETAIVAKNKPVKGYEEGLYPDDFVVEREQDGKLYNATFGGHTSSGVVNRPTVFLAGEEKPEMIISGTDYANFAPDFRQSLHREVARVKGYEDGYYPGEKENNSSSNDAELIKILQQNNIIMEKTFAVLDDINKKGVPAFLTRDMSTAKKMRDDILNYENYRNKAKIN